jgi:CSLREA domain-containing protein
MAHNTLGSAQPRAAASTRRVPRRAPRGAWWRLTALLALLVPLLGGMFALAPTARAAIITVNTAVDEDGENPLGCSLREAIHTANQELGREYESLDVGCGPDSPGSDTIAFNIAGGGPATITPSYDLPDVVELAIIDGTSQPGYAGTPLITLDGAPFEANDGLELYAGGSAVQGLAIAGFDRYGIQLAATRRLTNTGAITLTGNVIVNNGGAGIRVGDGDQNSIVNNTIIGNGTVGIFLGTSGNVVAGNRIGVDADGVTPRGNGGSGIRVDGGNAEGAGNDNQITGNSIAHNGAAGVAVIPPVVGNRILGNVIYGNVGLGIDLDPENLGPLANDYQDPDGGANNGQNAPVLTSALPEAGGTLIIGTFNSTPVSTFRLEFFANPGGCPAAPTGGQGQFLLGAVDVATDANGDAPISFATGPLLKGQAITATATSVPVEGSADTSEFSNCIQAEANDAPSFTKGADQVAVEDTAPRVVPNWATNIAPGPADEAGQAVAFDVANTNPALFAAQPAIAPDGTLTFIPAPGVNGSAVATVVLRDNGGTANGGVDTSAPQTFNLIVINRISPAGTNTVVATTSGEGTASPAGATDYAEGTEATYTATPGAGQLFVGWTLDGQYVGYANPLTFTVDDDRALVATFAAPPSFGDVPSGDPDHEAITRLAALGVINPAGVNGSGNFEPGREVARAEVAAFIARTFGWDDEFHRNTFPDRCDPRGGNCVDDELWNNVAALADYGVVGGYTDEATCQSAGTATPCYLPRDQVSRLQVVSIVARAFTRTAGRPTGSWDRLPAVPGQYTNVADEGTQRSDLATYRANAGPIPGQAGDGTFPDPTGPASRRFLVEVLFQAFSAEFGTDTVP